ncbi:prephenate dehydratase pheaip/act domain [hydrocarbon metagenome]|uniref:Prephenate dehydratase pheaip/act domain n=1 Tax=hydrocarbon metagenome TaxID=938273 RepID=A0A0W8E4Z2_9ZZZZ
MICAVLGPTGTFSEEAAHLYWGEDVVVSAAATIPELFRMLAGGEVEDVLVPIDNSQAGSIDVCINCLQEYPVSIKGEIVIPIRQHLIAARKYQLEDIELIISQPTALMQCGDFMDRSLKGVRTEITSSTTRALQIIGTETRKAAGIGNLRAAAIYGLEIIKEDIQNRDNTTRFVHITNNQGPLDGGQKASLICSLPDVPGALYKALEIFAVRNLNLNKIESRPDRIKQGSFCFYIEVEVDGNDQNLANALDELQMYCNSVKYLGSYNRKNGDADVDLL